MTQTGLRRIRIFIGSSGKDEAKAIVRDVQDALGEIKIKNCEIQDTAWCYDYVFKPGEYTLESLFREVSLSDAAIFIYNGDDELVKDGRKINVPRANVIFEHGLFLGRLGKERTFVLLTGGKQDNSLEERKAQTPILSNVLSDYNGISWYNYAKARYRSSGLINELTKWLSNSVLNRTEKGDEVTASIVESNTPNDHRDKEFLELYQTANGGDQIRVLGLGVTSFLNGTNIDDLLERGVKITILLMDDKIIKYDNTCEIEKFFKQLPDIKTDHNNSCPVTINNILIDKNHFSDYQRRSRSSMYLQKMQQAYSNCVKYRERFPKLFSFYYFHSFFPMSMTALQKKGQPGSGKAIVEFIIPFTKNRILLKVDEHDDKRIFDTFMSFYSSIEKESKKETVQKD